MSEFKPSLHHRVTKFLGQQDYRPLKQHELARALKLAGKGRIALRQTLRELEETGKVIRLRKNRWALPDTGRMVTGALSVHVRGFGFVTPDEAGTEDVYIPSDALGVALHGDRVQVSAVKLPPRRKGTAGGPELSSRVEGRIVRVLERRHTRVVGLLKRSAHYAYVIPDNPRLLHEVRVNQPSAIDLQEGHKVMVRLDEWDNPGSFLTGDVVEDLGPADTPGIEILSLMRDYHLDSEFPAQAASQGAGVSPALQDSDFEGRRDLRSWRTLTVDPVDARDYDDAVSLTRGSSGELVLGIHIADVPHFVHPGTALDSEALARGNSVYLVDRVVTMLPRHLTSEVCSLELDQDRLTHTVLLTLTADGAVSGTETFLSVIRSRARLNYDQVQAFIEESSDHGVPLPIQDDLRDMWALSRLLRARRLADGAVDLAMPEVKCVMDDDGRAVDIVRREAMEAYQLIEEFMLMANRAVALLMAEREVPALYRIHTAPDEEQWQQMGLGLQALGIDRSPGSRAEINALLRSIRGTPTAYAAHIAILRSFKRAMYSPTLEGHFGLGFDHYTHFTSPIRRYPDLVVHRILRAIESGRPPPHPREELAGIADHCSTTERAADEAEETSLIIKRLEYYERRMWDGQVGPFTGIITGIIPKGLLVEALDTLQRGLVSFSSMQDDYYRMSADGSRAMGRRTRAGWRVGEIVSVTVARVDRARRLIDFQMAEPKTGGRRKAARRQRMR